MRGDKKQPLTAASIVDDEGNFHYHILPNKWVKFIAAAFILLLALCVLLGLMILINKFAIDDLEYRLREGQYANTQHLSR